MDMSVKLNAPFPATAVQGNNGAKPTASASAMDGSATQATPTAGRADLEQAVKDIQSFVQSSQRNLNFSIDDSTGTVVVKVIATDSGEVVRQLPTETALKLAQDLNSASHMLLNARA